MTKHRLIEFFWAYAIRAYAIRPYGLWATVKVAPTPVTRDTSRLSRVTFFAFCILLSASVCLSAQTVNNVRATFTDCHIEVRYDLTTPLPVNLTLMYSGDGGNTWLPCGTVSGDTANQSSGTNKLIIWDNKTDHIVWGKFEFRVDAPKPALCGCTVNSTLTTPPYNGKLTFMCYNLGAAANVQSMTPAQQAAHTTPNDNYGDLYQWGRPSDGHEKRTSNTTTTLATTNIPGHANFIIGSADWRSGGGQTTRWGDGTQNANVAKAANDPCPAGWRVPTQAEWASIYGTTSSNTWTWNSSGTTGYKITPSGSSEPSLFLPAAGFRYYYDGSLNYVGTDGDYWSSTVYGTGSYGLGFYSSVVSPGSSYRRAYGFSLRCVAEL